MDLNSIHVDEAEIRQIVHRMKGFQTPEGQVDQLIDLIRVFVAQNAGSVVVQAPRVGEDGVCPVCGRDANAEGQLTAECEGLHDELAERNRQITELNRHLAQAVGNLKVAEGLAQARTDALQQQIEEYRLKISSLEEEAKELRLQLLEKAIFDGAHSRVQDSVPQTVEGLVAIEGLAAPVLFHTGGPLTLEQGSAVTVLYFDPATHTLSLTVPDFLIPEGAPGISDHAVPVLAAEEEPAPGVLDAEAFDPLAQEASEPLPGEKRCAVCGEVKPKVGGFRPDRDYEDGYRKKCYDCTRAGRKAS